MNLYFKIITLLIPIIFFGSLIGLIYSFIRKKRKIPWILGIASSIILTIFIVALTDAILDKVEIPDEKIEETSTDPAGSVRLKSTKYIVGDEIKEGVFDITFQKDSGSLEVVPLDISREFSDITFFGNNKKFRIYLKEGDGLDIKSGIAIVSPADETIRPYEETKITAGIWVTGISLSPGKYQISNIERPGNIAQFDNKRQYVMSEILSEGITLDLQEGDYIVVNGTALTLIPINE